jgi:fido (protein-threonine AMPylation protein)
LGLATRLALSFMAQSYKDEKLSCAPEEKADLEIANQRLVVEYLADFVQKGRTRITEADVLEIHDRTIRGIYPCAGKFRDATTEVTITGTNHKPAHPSQVKIEIRDMLEWHYGEGQRYSPVCRATRMMWKVNAVHPFNGGNGRVARSLAYLVIVSEVAPIFAGEPLPTKLKARKDEYVNGLQSADKGDLGPLERLVLDCFEEQLKDIYAQAAGT